MSNPKRMKPFYMWGAALIGNGLVYMEESALFLYKKEVRAWMADWPGKENKDWRLVRIKLSEVSANE